MASTIPTSLPSIWIYLVATLGFCLINISPVFSQYNDIFRAFALAPEQFSSGNSNMHSSGSPMGFSWTFMPPGMGSSRLPPSPSPFGKTGMERKTTPTASGPADFLPLADHAGGSMMADNPFSISDWAQPPISMDTHTYKEPPTNAPDLDSLTDGTSMALAILKNQQKTWRWRYVLEHSTTLIGYRDNFYGVACCRRLPYICGIDGLCLIEESECELFCECAASPLASHCVKTIPRIKATVKELQKKMLVQVSNKYGIAMPLKIQNFIEGMAETELNTDGKSQALAIIDKKGKSWKWEYVLENLLVKSTSNGDTFYGMDCCERLPYICGVDGLCIIDAIECEEFCECSAIPYAGHCQTIIPRIKRKMRELERRAIIQVAREQNRTLSSEVQELLHWMEPTTAATTTIKQTNTTIPTTSSPPTVKTPRIPSSKTIRKHSIHKITTIKNSNVHTTTPMSPTTRKPIITMNKTSESKSSDYSFGQMYILSLKPSTFRTTTSAPERLTVQNPQSSTPKALSTSTISMSVKKETTSRVVTRKPLLGIHITTKIPLSGFHSTTHKPLTGLGSNTHTTLNVLDSTTYKPLTGLGSTTNKPLAEVASTKYKPVTGMFSTIYRSLPGIGFTTYIPLPGLVSTTNKSLIGITSTTYKPLTRLNSTKYKELPGLGSTTHKHLNRIKSTTHRPLPTTGRSENYKSTSLHLSPSKTQDGIETTTSTKGNFKELTTIPIIKTLKTETTIGPSIRLTTQTSERHSTNAISKLTTQSRLEKPITSTASIILRPKTTNVLQAFRHETTKSITSLPSFPHSKNSNAMLLITVITTPLSRSVGMLNKKETTSIAMKIFELSTTSQPSVSDKTMFLSSPARSYANTSTTASLAPEPKESSQLYHSSSTLQSNALDNETSTQVSTIYFNSSSSRDENEVTLETMMNSSFRSCDGCDETGGVCVMGNDFSAHCVKTMPDDACDNFNCVHGR